MKRQLSGKKVFIGLSGGVDSSVSAALLKRAGFDVHGVFIRTWSPEWLPCTWKEERQDAMRAAAHLDIPFTTLDLENEYKKDVADYMIAEYKAGCTPNPDVMCNKYIKFGAFYDWAMNEGAQYVSTGHYARVEMHDGRWKLLAGIDKNKDQSYFLWTLKEEQLAHILFPVGQFTKPEVRRLAESFGLPTASKKDSQGLCFMGKVDVKDFLSHYIRQKPGVVVNCSGEEIGYHNGAAFLTIGERHGFTVTKKSSKDEPYFVLAKNSRTNKVVVGHRAELFDVDPGQTATVTDLNLIYPELPLTGVIMGRVRYRQPLTQLSLKKDRSVFKAVFNEPQIIAPGQSLVLYDGDVCLGGGILDQ